MPAAADLFQVTLVLASFAAATCQERVWYVKPTPDSPCARGVPDERCYTFYQILHNVTIAETVFSSNTILAVLGGDHILNFEAEAFLTVRDLQNFTLLGSPERVVASTNLTQPASRIVCISRFAVAFINSSRLSFTNLTFSNCGANLTDELAVEALSRQTHGIHYFDVGLKAALLLVNVQTFQMVSCVVESSYGLGLLGVNVLGESAVLGSTFFGNNNYTSALGRCTSFPNDNRDIVACSGGNALFVFEDLKQCPQNKTQYKLQILNSAFLLGVNGFGGRLLDEFLTRGAGLGIVLSQSSYGVTVIIKDTVIFGNVALIGANLYIAVYETVDNSTISLQNSTILSANRGLLSTENVFEESGSSSGGLHVDYNIPIEKSAASTPVCKGKKKHREDIMTITDCNFQENLALIGGGVFLQIRTSADNEHVARFRIERCTFRDNVATSGTAIYISQQESIYRLGTSEVVFQDVNILANTYVTPIRNLTELYTNFQLNAVQLIQAENVSFTNCVFAGNEGSALSAFGSEIFISSSVFNNNSGIVGGAINLENSHLYFAPDTQITFRGNYALLHGGAINVIGRLDVVFPCFYQLLDLEKPTNVTLHFEGNYAEEAGSILYGGSVDRCIITAQSALNVNSSAAVFDSIVDIGPHSNATSLISSDSMTVCACVDDVPMCTIRRTEFTLPPGATVDLPFVTVGQRHGITPSTVYVSTGPNTTLGQFQQAQQVSKTCTSLNFTIETVAPNTNIVVRTSSLTVNGGFTIEVELTSCPLGFVLNYKGQCTCDPVSQLPDYDSICDINTQTVHRRGGSWISPDFSGPNGSYDGTIVFVNCPYDYCRGTDTDVDMTDPDSQCSFNRTGVLCGACKPGLSITLGSSICRECSNTNIAFLLVFFVIAIALVALLYVLNFTISSGRLSGIIFYANIVYVNYTIFFDTRSTGALLLIISWLNLDWASEYCIYDGADEYIKVWLGYAFPFLIWVIVLVIILVSRFSNTVARLSGSRSVPVLATLLLLSYNRLLGVVIVSLSFSIITYPDSSLRVVWTKDGNIDYWSGKHIPLGMFAILVILFFIIPYTLLLLLVPLSFIQAHSTHRLLSWINKLKPFMDAHQGPLKNKFRNWTGILLLIRILLSILNAINVSSYDDDVVLLITAMVMFLLMGFGWVARGGMYKKWPLNILEGSFFLNLGILSVATLFVKQAEGREQNAAIHTSGIIALLELGGVLVYHTYKQINALRRFKEFKDMVIAKVKARTQPKERDQVELLDSSTTTADTTTTTVVSFVTLREPLIED